MSEQDSNASNAILAELLRRIDAGEQVDVDALCSAHPEIADDLRSYVDGDALLADMADEAATSDTSQPGVHDETVRPRGQAGPAIDMSGQTFGRYEIKRQLGQGAMGAVYLARDTQLDRDVALKIPKVGLAEKAEFLTRFKREAQSAAKLNHPGICPVFDFGEHDGAPYITMAYIEGEPLSRFVGRKQVDNQWIVDVVRKIAEALAHAHEFGVIHRDLKSANVLMDRNGDPIVTDFGLAARVDQEEETRITQMGAIIGTPAYMSPEQIEGDSAVIGPPTDIYALGVILYELLAGELPFRGSMGSLIAQITRDDPKSPIRHNPDADPTLVAYCLKLLSKRPSQRPASMAAIASDLAAITLGKAKPTPDDDKTKKKLAKLEAGKAKVADLVQRGQFAKAVAVLEKMAVIKDPDAAEYATWAKSEVKRIKAMPKKLRDGAPQLLIAAKKLMAKHDYGQAAQLLQQVPADMRSPELSQVLHEAIELQDEADLLLTDLHDCVNTRAYDGIEDNVQRLLELKPGNKFARELWEALETYQKVPRAQRNYRFDGSGQLQPRDEGLSKGLLAGIGVGVVVFAAMAFAMKGYLAKPSDEAGKITVAEGSTSASDIAESSGSDSASIERMQPTLAFSHEQPATWVTNSLAFDPTGRYLLAGIRNKPEAVYGRTWKFDTSGEEAPKELLDDDSSPKSSMHDIQLSENGRYFVGGLQAVELWDSSTFKFVRDFPMPQGKEHVNHVAISPDEKWVAGAAVGAAEVCIWERNTGKVAKLFPVESENNFTISVQFTPDGSKLISTAKPKGDPKPRDVYIVDLSTMELTNTKMASNSHDEVHLLNDRLGVASVWNNERPYVFDVATWKPVQRFGEREDGFSVTCSPDERWVATINHGDSQISIFETNSWTHVAAIPTRGAKAAQIRFSRNSQRLALSAEKKDASDNTIAAVVQVWDLFKTVDSKLGGTTATTSLSFNGTKDRVEIPSLVYDGSYPITVEAWVKPNSSASSGGMFFSACRWNTARDATGLHLGYLGSDQTKKWHFACMNGQTIEKSLQSSSFSGPAGWTHVAATRDGRDVALFVNGVEVGRRTLDKDFVPATEFVYLGGVPKREPTFTNLYHRFQGSIDELRVSNVIRFTDSFTPTREFAADANTVALYHFDEGSGDVLKDSSGNGHDGKIVAASWIEGLPVVDDSPTWTTLFNGRDFTGWRQYGGGPAGSGWEIKNGQLCTRGDGADIITSKQYRNFELEFEWMAPDGGDGGVLYRVVEGPRQTFMSGLEYQALDDPEKKLIADPLRRAGALFSIDNIETPIRPRGQFNTSRIRVVDNHVEHWLNEAKTVDITIGSPAWKNAVTASKFKDTPTFAKSQDGHIAMQHMRKAFCYRNIRIRELPSDRSAASTISRDPSRFTNPRPVTALATTGTPINAYPWISPDGLTIYWTSEGPSADSAIYQATRPSTRMPFTNKRKVCDGRIASVSSDGLEIVALSTSNNGALSTARRSSTTRPFGALQPISSLAGLSNPKGTAFGLNDNELLVLNMNKGTAASDLVRSVRNDSNQPWVTPEPITVRGLAGDMNRLSHPSLSSDRKHLFFSFRDITKPSREWGAIADATSDPNVFINPRPLLLDGQRFITRGGRYCEATGELFYAHMDGEPPFREMEIYVADVATAATSLSSTLSTGLEFNGRSYLEIPSYRYDGTTPLTVEAFISNLAPDNRSRGRFISNNEASGFYLAVGEDNDSVRFLAAQQNGRFVGMAPKLTPGPKGLLHVAGVIDDRKLMLFIDGKKLREETLPTPHRPSVEPILIGLQPTEGGGPGYNVQPFHGRIHAVRVSSRVVYTDDFAIPAELVADNSTECLYRMDEGNGDQIRDASRHQRHGTAIGTKWFGDNDSSAWTNLLAPSQTAELKPGWKYETDGTLKYDANGLGVQTIFAPTMPAAYEVDVDFTTNDDINQLGLTLPIANGLCQFMLFKNGPSPGGLESIDGQQFQQAAVQVSSQQLGNVSRNLRVSVDSSPQTTTIVARCDNTEVFRWSGDTDRLSLTNHWDHGQPGKLAIATGTAPASRRAGRKGSCDVRTLRWQSKAMGLAANRADTIGSTPKALGGLTNISPDGSYQSARSVGRGTFVVPVLKLGTSTIGRSDQSLFSEDQAYVAVARGKHSGKVKVWDLRFPFQGPSRSNQLLHFMLSSSGGVQIQRWDGGQVKNTFFAGTAQAFRAGADNELAVTVVGTQIGVTVNGNDVVSGIDVQAELDPARCSVGSLSVIGKPPVFYSDHVVGTAAGSYAKYSKLFTNVENVLRSDTGLQEKVIGSTGSDLSFRIPDNPAIVVGIQCRISDADQPTNAHLLSAQPVFATSSDVLHSGDVMKVATRRRDVAVTSMAKPGYALAAIEVGRSGRIDRLRVRYAKIAANRLDMNDSYLTSWLFGESGDSLVVGGDGAPVVSLASSSTNSATALGLVLMK